MTKPNVCERRATVNDFDRRPCPNCDGSGFVEWFEDRWSPAADHYTVEHTAECDECDGSGELADDEDEEEEGADPRLLQQLLADQKRETQRYKELYLAAESRRNASEYVLRHRSVRVLMMRKASKLAISLIQRLTR